MEHKLSVPYGSSANLKDVQRLVALISVECNRASVPSADMTQHLISAHSS